MSNSECSIPLNLPGELTQADFFTNEPFVIFEQKEFIAASDYNLLVQEVSEANVFDYTFSGKGEKRKFSINGANWTEVSQPTLKKFCRGFFEDAFYEWFKKTHLVHFKFNRLTYFIKNPYSLTFRLTKKIRNIFGLPISFFYSEIEYSSIAKGGYIPPHTDAARKRLSFVFYLPDTKQRLTPNMKSVLGTIFWKKKCDKDSALTRFDCQLLDGGELSKFHEDYEVAHIGQYEENKIAGFIKSDRSWHSVQTNCFDYDRRAIVINVWEA